MAKISNVKTAAPGAEAPAKAASAPTSRPENSVVDALGRVLVIEEPDIVAESRIIRALGDAAQNASYLTAYVMPAVMVSSIDGEPCAQPKTALEIEGAIKRVGRHGITAVLQYLNEQVEAEAAKEDVKNSSGTPSSEAAAG
ncbi:hypothetical protein Herbaro_09445 [Herbaspirillum sp. WKF16]|uniref:hypothetical protein n=1 Tax=Herbaspirillum sp. WKF16 TaxID=3028312 RepID=UPI0023A96D97|nr:hypothetical protein [Herbaspirillum sp. WKF16]WDZ97984.1 hypothetical protein Herbaro_09445 [Herbaspirillum sp. WKF16]